MLQTDQIPSPNEMTNVGDGDYKATGDEFFGYFRDLCKLQPHHRILDVGCGIGRMARPLTSYLDSRGSYEGFDIVPEGVAWCQEHISPRFPAFQFRHSDIYNRGYYPQGWYRADEYSFPYRDESFDFVLLTSVFTHMLPSDLENYFAEIARVLKPHGCCLMSYFLRNSESEHLMETKASSLQFPIPVTPICTALRTDPLEDAVCYSESYISDLYPSFGLDIISPIHYGNWCGRSQFLSYQDIVIATKTGPLPISRKIAFESKRYLRRLRPASLLRFSACTVRRLLPGPVKRFLRRNLTLVKNPPSK